MKRSMKKVINYLENISLEQEEYIISEPNFSNDLYAILENFFKQMQDVLKNYSDYVTDLFLEVFRMTNKFIKISEFVGKGFKTYYVNCNKNLIARIKCLDSSSLIEKTLKKLKSAIFFSATLTPLDYYVQCLGREILLFYDSISHYHGRDESRYVFSLEKRGGCSNYNPGYSG